MPTQLNTDIWYLIVDILEGRFRTGDSRAKESLLALRLTHRSLAVAIAPILLSNIKVVALDKVTNKRLDVLLRSPSTCQSVRSYELEPKIIRTRQGDMSTAYHRVPPHLDYGRNSASKVIQEENASLRLAAGRWEEQYRIVYPPQSKASAFIKKTFQWSGSRNPGLRETSFLTALDAFTNLSRLCIKYPAPENTRIIHDVANEYSFSLARYLSSRPTGLSELQIRSITPDSLEILTNNIKRNNKESSFSLSTTSFDLFMEPQPGFVRNSLHTYPGAGDAVTMLLHAMPHLTTLRVFYFANGREKSPLKLEHLFVSPLAPPALPALKDLMLGGLALSDRDLLALVTSTPDRLTGLVLDSISLTSSTWARVFQSFAASETLEYVIQPTLVSGMAYHEMPTGLNKSYQTQDDYKGHLEWEAKIDRRLRDSTGEGLPRDAKLPRNMF